MRKIFEHHVFEKVGYFRSILESEGIATLLKNEADAETGGVFGGVGPYPELWVMEDDEYDRALEILRPHYEAFG